MLLHFRATISSLLIFSTYSLRTRFWAILVLLLELESPALLPTSGAVQSLEPMRIVTVCFTTSFLAIVHSRICSTVTLSRSFRHIVRNGYSKPKLHIIVSVAMFLYNYIITFVDLVWSSRWGVRGSGVLVAKVHAFYWHCMVVYRPWARSIFGRHSFTNHIATPLTSWDRTWLRLQLVLSLSADEQHNPVILTLRAWAVWNRDKYLAIFLPTFCGMAIIAN